MIQNITGVNSSTPLTTKNFMGSVFGISVSVLMLLICLIGVEVNNSLLPIAIVFSLPLLYAIVRRPGYALIAFITIVVTLQLKYSAVGKSMSLLDVAAGALILLIMVVHYLRFKLVGIPIIRNSYYQLFEIFILLGLISGLTGFVFGEVSFENLLREILIYSPVIIMPSLYIRYKEHNPAYQNEFIILLLLWVCIFVSAIYKIGSSLASIVYLYQLGKANNDIVNAAFMIFVFTALSSIYCKYKYIFIIGLAVSLIGLILTFNRTTWVSVVICSIIMLLIMPKNLRRNGIRTLLLFTTIAILVGVVLYFISPFIRIGILFFTQKFLTTGNVGTDVSFLNRLVEWRMVIDRIYDSPIIGQGIGGEYWVYNWLLGHSMFTGYTHNAYLGLLLKGGVIGFILFITSFIGLLLTAYKLANNTYISLLESSILFSCVSLLLMLLINGITVNVFSHREILLYIGFAWSFILHINSSYPSQPNNLVSTP